MEKPVIKQDPLYQLLRTEDIKGFNEQRDKLDTGELKSGDYRKSALAPAKEYPKAKANVVGRPKKTRR